MDKLIDFCGMVDFLQRRKIKKAFYSKITIAIVFILVVLLGHATWNVGGKYMDARENEQIVRSEFDALAKREESLRTDIEKLADEQGIEAEMRRRFNVVKEGEEILIITGDGRGDEGDNTTGYDNDGFWTSIISWFK